MGNEKKYSETVHRPSLHLRDSNKVYGESLPFVVDSFNLQMRLDCVRFSSVVKSGFAKSDAKRYSMLSHSCLFSLPYLITAGVVNVNPVEAAIHLTRAILCRSGS